MKRKKSRIKIVMDNSFGNFERCLLFAERSSEQAIIERPNNNNTRILIFNPNNDVNKLYQPHCCYNLFKIILSVCVCDRVSLRQIVNLHFSPLHCPFCIHIDDDDAFIWRSSSLMTIASTLCVDFNFIDKNTHILYTSIYRPISSVSFYSEIDFFYFKKTRRSDICMSRNCVSEVKSSALRRDTQKGKMNVLTLYILANQSISFEGICMWYAQRINVN